MIHCWKCNTTEKYTRKGKRETKCRKCKTYLEYQCGKCGRLYKTLQTLKYHQTTRCNEGPKTHRKRIVKPNLPKFHKCSKCGNDFVARSDMRRHEKVCGKPATLQCQLCPYATSYSQNLRRHIRQRHTELDDKDYKVCGLCGKKFKSYLGFKLHANICGEVFGCAHCPFRVDKKRRLIKHLQLQHSQFVIIYDG